MKLLFREKSEHEIMNICKEHQNKMELFQTEIDSFDEKIKLMNAENVTREKDLRTVRYIQYTYISTYIFI